MGAVVFCCLGFAVAASSATWTPSSLSSGSSSRSSFISGDVHPASELPHWLADIGKVFPDLAFAAALVAAYNPHTTGCGLPWGDLALLAAWGVAGLIIAIRRFSWLPRDS